MYRGTVWAELVNGISDALACILSTLQGPVQDNKDDPRMTLTSQKYRPGC